jgi:hypothetical protein
MSVSEASDSDSVANSDLASGYSNIEPDPEGPMFPFVSTYVAFTIDPVATLAALDDPEVASAASRLNPKTYVGYVRNVRMLQVLFGLTSIMIDVP